MKIVGKIIKYFLVALLIFTVGFMFLRVLTSGDTAIAKNFLWTEEAKNSYLKAPDSFRVYSVELMREYTEEGKFRVSNVRYAESETDGIEQLQFTVRWNDSTIVYLREDFGLDGPPETEPFVFTLTDDLGNIYTDYQTVSDTKPLYNYRRLVFDISDFAASEYFYVNIYYSGTYDAEDSKPYGTLSVYSRSLMLAEYDLKKSDLP